MTKNQIKCFITVVNEHSFTKAANVLYISQPAISKSISNMEEELGDILFAVVNLARWYKIDAEQALLKTNKKFEKRFRTMEDISEKPLKSCSFSDFDLLWNKAKDILKNQKK